jgi:uncharacterized protein (TIGR02145 family)
LILPVYGFELVSLKGMKREYRITVSVILVISVIIFQSCEKKKIPVVETGEISNITGSTATCVGTVIDEGSSPLYTRGVCWSENSEPTIDDNFTNNGTGVGTYTSTMTRLYGSTEYYVRAYATNDDGTGYGDEVIFHTAPRNIVFNSAVTYGSLTDYDGNKYRTVQIGQQTWMAENLRVIHYNDGSEIRNVTDMYYWSQQTEGAWCYYENDTLNRNIYGVLYNWYAVDDQHKLCPDGWHVPNVNEWTILEESLGGSNYAGMKMKETGQSHWANPNLGATNESGFTALPGGSRYLSIQYDFWNFGYYAIFWTSSEVYSNNQNAYYRYLSSEGVNVVNSSWKKLTGFSVRCVKN